MLWQWVTGTGPKQPPPDESLGPARPGEVRPPWIEYPGFGPTDFFWRQSGEAWRHYVWEPYYNALGPEEQAAYRTYWKVPQEWWDFYFDPEWCAFMDHVDDPEDEIGENQ